MTFKVSDISFFKVASKGLHNPFVLVLKIVTKVEILVFKIQCSTLIFAMISSRFNM